MTTSYIVRTTTFLMILIFSTSFVACAHKSADFSTSNKQMNRPTTTRASVKSAVTLGSGDVLDLSVWQNKDFSGSIKIDSAGNIFIPLVGEVKAAGLNTLELRNKITIALERYIIDPQVQLAVTSYRSRKVYVLGEVKNPGIYQMDDSLTTIIAALSAAGGFTDDASTNNVVHLKEGLDKGDAQVLRIGSYLYNDHNHDGHLQNASLKGGDVIYVPSSFMANIDHFFEHVAKIVAPIVNIERAITLEPFAKDVLEGKSIDNKILVIP